MLFMLGRLPHRVRVGQLIPKHGCSRYYSAHYPPKGLRAFPFMLSAEKAIIQMAPTASLVCMFKNIVGSLGARYLPGFGFEPLRPSRIKPVYFPAWVIDVEVQASVSVTLDQEVIQRTAAVQFQNSYLPGSDFKVLSMVSLWPDNLQDIEAVAFTEDLETQYGAEVLCLPYTISPFSAVNIVNSLSYSQAIISDKIRFAPTSFTPNMLAAYPVLIPLYLAQYEYTIPGLDNPRSITLVMEAYSPEGRILTEKIGAEAGTALRDQLPNAPPAFLNFTRQLDGIAVYVARGAPAPFARLAGLSIVPPGHELGSVIGDWLDEILGSDSTAQILSGSGTIDFDDPRIRELVLDETSINRAWMAVSRERDTLRAVVNAMTTAQEGDIEIVQTDGSMSTQDLVKSATEGLGARADELTKTREETKPIWWKEWEERTRPGDTS